MNGSADTVNVELLYDYPRLEEKLIMERLKRYDMRVMMTNVNNRPLQLGEKASDISLIRTISMYKAIYAAAVRESGGTYTVNNSETILLCGDKILTLSRIKKVGLNIPRSVVAMGKESAEAAQKSFKKPFVDKPPIGSWGRLVTLISDPIVWRSILEHREMLSSQQLRVHILQDYIEGEGRDIRAIVVGENVLGAIYRVSTAGEWRSNIALGSKPAYKKMDPELKEAIIKAAEVVNGAFVSVDLLEGDGTYYVNEVNGVPEFKGFMEATGIDVADEVAKFVRSEVRK
ncbi:MAG: lysine biosynthesis protein LysX [Aigarchaeota archaeon]|nr:lysine biosynthesis protein LysX [Aigarchaeota archaeon]MDW8093318.1 lysine biosynthesis protein LysX [Nitrososphaerota archaeon]